MTEPNLRRWAFRSWDWQLGEFPLLMGIINCTPDSFSDGGRFSSANDAVKHGLQLAEDGADILDVGGESTRPGSARVSEEEELRRVLPVIERLAEECDVPISIDTTKSVIARRALQAGAHIVNDISGLTFDAEMTNVCREEHAGVICMHIRGTPETMQDDPQYEDVVSDVRDWLAERLTMMEAAGISPERVVLDAGIGFGKTPEHNLELLSHIAKLRALQRPVLVGHSRKRFLKWILHREVNEREFGTVGVAIALAQQNVDIIRCHDVQAVRDALTAWKTVMDAGVVEGTLS